MIDLHRRAPVDHCVIRKCRHTEVMMHVARPVVEANPAAEQFALGIGGGAIGAKIALPRQTAHARSARRKERQDDPVTNGKLRIVRVAGLDHRCACLMAQRHRHRSRPVAVDHRQVRMAQPGGFDLDEQLTGSRRIERQRSKAERTCFAKWSLMANLVQRRSVDFHLCPLARPCFRSASRIANGKAFNKVLELSRLQANGGEPKRSID